MSIRLVAEAGGFVVEEDGRAVLRATTPVGLRLADDGHRAAWSAYDRVEPDADGALDCRLDVALPGDGSVRIHDVWRLDAEELRLARDLVVLRPSPVPFSAGVGITWLRPDGWDGVEPFAPGAVYGRSAPVAEFAFGAPAALALSGTMLLRTDRMAAPVVALADAERWVAVAEPDPDLRTVAADADDRRGRAIADAGIHVASLGAAPLPDGMVLQAWRPAIEGDVTYDSGALPLGQHPGWRERFLPATEGARSTLRIAVGWGAADGRDAAWDAVWTRAARRHRPSPGAPPPEDYLDAVVDVLASQVRAGAGRIGIGLESDPVAGAPLPGADAAVMGFVGANTDAAEVLLRAARRRTGDAAARLRAAAHGILDTFCALAVDPPAGEGFSLADGSVVTYRDLDGRPAVFLRALAEGADAALRAADLADADGDAAAADRWSAWAHRAAAWLVRQQRADGTFPRAWEAGTGVVLQHSPTATASAVPLLLRSGRAEAAVRAGEAVWARVSGVDGYAGGTLDNPDVVDKEAAVLTLEAFLRLGEGTGDSCWVERAAHAARVARTWIHLVDVPMPADADAAAPHWKPGVPTAGMQLITSGVTMSDGFLVANAAAFVRLARLTGDDGWLDIARLVHHGSIAMLATRARPYDLAGPGWQQEHWNLGPARGFGLNRSWLPWTAVAVAGGVLRLIDEGADDVLS